MSTNKGILRLLPSGLDSLLEELITARIFQIDSSGDMVIILPEGFHL